MISSITYPHLQKEVSMFTKMSKKAVSFALAFALVFTCFAVTTQTTQAASKPAKPKFVTSSCSYTGGYAKLKWKKVKGAKKYKVLRSKTKGGKYKVIATTKKTKINKKSKGEYYYKVRAYNGNKKSNLSKPIHLFAASGNIYYKPSFTLYIGGWYGYTRTTAYSAIKNDSKKTMTIPKNATYKVRQIDRKTKKDLIDPRTGTFSEKTVIKPGKTESIATSVGGRISDDCDEFYYQIEVPFKAGGKKFKLKIKTDCTTIPGIKK